MFPFVMYYILDYCQKIVLAFDTNSDFYATILLQKKSIYFFRYFKKIIYNTFQFQEKNKYIYYQNKLQN